MAPKPTLVDDQFLSSFDNRGGPPDDGDMDERIRALETAVAAVKSDLEVVRANYATKSDVAEIRADLHKTDASIRAWMLGTVLTVIGTTLAAIFGVAQVFKTANTPIASQPTTSAPIVIQVPTPVTPAPAK